MRDNTQNYLNANPTYKLTFKASVNLWSISRLAANRPNASSAGSIFFDLARPLEG